MTARLVAAMATCERALARGLARSEARSELASTVASFVERGGARPPSASVVADALLFATLARWLDGGTCRSPSARALLDAARGHDLGPALDTFAATLATFDRAALERRLDGAPLGSLREPLLAATRPKQRGASGVFYTPAPIAAYQARRIELHLVRDLGLAGGLASPRVLVVDPACGAGAHLAALLSRAPSIAGRLVGIDVDEPALVATRLSLERSHRARPVLRLADALSSAALADLADRAADGGALVLVGNPPYEGFSAPRSADERRRLDDWIAPLAPAWGLTKHRLGELYVRFVRAALEAVERAGAGVVSFVTNRKWTVGRSFPSMREGVLRAFDRVVVDDLHGEVHGEREDESAFGGPSRGGVRCGLAIVTCVRARSRVATFAMVQRRDLVGTAAHKHAALSALSDDVDRGLAPCTPGARDRFRFAPAPAHAAPPIDAYFDFARSGVQPVRDAALVSTESEALAARMRDYFDPSLPFDELVARHPGFAVARARYDPERTRARLLDGGARFERARIVPFLYRPFDRRFLYWETRHKLVHEARRELRPYLLDGDDLVPVPGQRFLGVSRTPRRPFAARPVVTSALPCFHAVDPDCRVLPLLAPSGVNVRGPFLEAARRAGLDGGDVALADALFHALVAVTYAPAFARDAGRDGDDCPRVPLPSSADALARAASLGRRVFELCDADQPTLDDEASIAALEPAAEGFVLSAGTPRAAGRWSPDGSVWLDDARRLRNVPRAAWELSVGGFRVLPKWLGYRHGARLDARTLREATLLCRRLAALAALAPALDAVWREAAASPLRA